MKKRYSGPSAREQQQLFSLAIILGAFVQLRPNLAFVLIPSEPLSSAGSSHQSATGGDRNVWRDLPIWGVRTQFVEVLIPFRQRFIDQNGRPRTRYRPSFAVPPSAAIAIRRFDSGKEDLASEAGHLAEDLWEYHCGQAIMERELERGGLQDYRAAAEERSEALSACRGRLGRLEPEAARREVKRFLEQTALRANQTTRGGRSNNAPQPGRAWFRKHAQTRRSGWAETGGRAPVVGVRSQLTEAGQAAGEDYRAVSASRLSFLRPGEEDAAAEGSRKTTNGSHSLLLGPGALENKKDSTKKK